MLKRDTRYPSPIFKRLDPVMRTTLAISLCLLFVACAPGPERSERDRLERLSKGDAPVGSCVDACGGEADSGACYCDDLCDRIGDCCDDREAVCNDKCEPVVCDLWCENGFKVGDDGCEFCECNDECEPVLCDLWCENGFKVGDDGCEVCECNDECEPVLCDLWCENGFKVGDDGCEVCECNDECEPELCEMYCEYGFKRDEKGCEYCECAPPPCDAAAYCEAVCAGEKPPTLGDECPIPGCYCGPITCGGFAGITCSEGQECIDDPDDGCDPAKGDADCVGTCQPASDE